MYWITGQPCPKCGTFKISKEDFDNAMRKILAANGLKYSASSNAFEPELWKGLAKIFLGKGKPFLFFCVKCGFTDFVGERRTVDADGKPYKLECSKETTGCCRGGRRHPNKHKCMLPTACGWAKLK